MVKVNVNGVSRRLAWVGTSPKYGSMKKRAAVAAPAEITASNNLAVILPAIKQWIRDQGGIGSCATFATLYLAVFMQLQRSMPFIPLSPLDLYKLVRIAIGTYPDDSGSTMFDPAWVIHKQGVAPEKDWPYVDSEFNDEAPKACITDRPKHIVKDEFAIPNFSTALNQLDKRGPYMHGIAVFPNWPGLEGNPDKGDGIVPDPGPTDWPIGGHGMMVLDKFPAHYKHTFGPKPVTVPFAHVLVCNSWGPSWGYSGFCFFSTKYVGNDDLCNERIELLSEIDEP